MTLAHYLFTAWLLVSAFVFGTPHGTPASTPSSMIWSGLALPTFLVGFAFQCYAFIALTQAENFVGGAIVIGLLTLFVRSGPGRSCHVPELAIMCSVAGMALALDQLGAAPIHHR